MPDFGSCNVFLRATFGIDPGAEIGRQLGGLATQLHVRRRQDIEIDPAEATLVFLSSGATKLGAMASRGRHQIVAFHFGGDIFTVPAVNMHRYTLTGLCESTLTTFPAREFYDRAAANPWIMRALLERSQAALFRCRDKAVNLGQKSAGERVAGFLLAMWERLDAAEGPGSMIELPMSRGDIGESLGL
jgi:CRP-like cAMP-binding protein